MKPYGKELILDMHGCDVSKFNRKDLKAYFVALCDEIDMERQKLVFWDDEGLPPEECQTNPHTKGTSAVQFIITSNVTIHCLDILRAVYVNIFSCKDFNISAAGELTKKWFGATECSERFIERV